MEWKFGFLPNPIGVIGDDWSIEPLSTYEETTNEWKTYGDSYGWILPPIVYSEKRIPQVDGTFLTEVDHNTRRSTSHWNIPPTHKLIYSGSNVYDEEQERYGIAGFLMHALGCIYGVELQFDNWYVMSRIRSKPGGPFVPNKKAVISALKILPQWYNSQSSECKIVITNSLFMHNHVPSYENSWEEFLWQYVAFDGCWNVALNQTTPRITTGSRSTSGEWRFKIFADKYGLISKPLHFKEWAKIRDDLVHEVTWGGVMPSHSPDDKVYSACMFLRKFTTMALLACMSYDSESLSIDWHTSSRLALNPP